MSSRRRSFSSPAAFSVKVMATMRSRVARPVRTRARMRLHEDGGLAGAGAGFEQERGVEVADHAVADGLVGGEAGGVTGSPAASGRRRGGGRPSCARPAFWRARRRRAWKSQKSQVSATGGKTPARGEAVEGLQDADSVSSTSAVAAQAFCL